MKGALALFTLVAGLAACNAPDGAGSRETAPPTPASTTELASPAGPGSAEPFLAAGATGIWMSWLEAGDSTHALRVARLDGGTWSEPRTVVESSLFFVNWADFPSVAELSDGRLMAHWLQRSSAGKYSYDVMVSFSADAGSSWSPPVRPHSDGTPTEHGFVSLFESPAGPAAVWLDGRGYAGAGGEPGTGEMSLRYTSFGADGVPVPDIAIDTRTCDCCQTDGAITAHGPVIAYRDRSPDEVRDIVVSRFVDGEWTEPARVHADNWVIAACPVNGPAIAADGARVAVAWFTNAGDTARVNVAFSDDSGASFRAPARVDAGHPVGRVDAVMLDNGNALVSWLERSETGTRVLARIVGSDGRASSEMVIGESSEDRASGFPRIVRDGGRVLFAWTVPGTRSIVRVAEVRLGG